ncbi:unnamed protein product, partial [Ectocarpus sp. 6 AP-2014]
LLITTHILTEEEPSDEGPLQCTLEHVCNTMGIFRHPAMSPSALYFDSLELFSNHIRGSGHETR